MGMRRRGGTLAAVDIGDLGPFLRSRREAVSPADVGLAVGVRRRTPGLRRAEVATLAGISVDYLVRLEQGRDRHPSAQVLAAIADALRLDEHDRGFLRRFSVVTTGGELCPSVPVPATTVRTTVARMLDHFEPNPAFVLNRLADVLAWNAAFDRLARPVGLLNGARANLARYTFLDKRARSTYPDWNVTADDHAAALRAETWLDDPFAEQLLDDLRAIGSAFTDRWETMQDRRVDTGLQRFRHPDVGDLHMSFETMRLADEGQRLMVYLASDDATARAFDQLAGRYPGALRSVGSNAS